MPTPTSQSTVAVWTTGVLALIPPVLAAAAGLLLHSQDAERVAQLAAVLTALITAGVPVLHRSTGADCRSSADTGSSAIIHARKMRPGIFIC